MQTRARAGMHPPRAKRSANSISQCTPKRRGASDACTNIDTEPTHAQSMGLCVRGLPNVCVFACVRACVLVNQPGSRDTTLRRRSCVPSRTRRRSCVLVNMHLRVQVHEGGLFQVKPRHRCRGGDSRCTQLATCNACDVGRACDKQRATYRTRCRGGGVPAARDVACDVQIATWHAPFEH